MEFKIDNTTVTLRIEKSPMLNVNGLRFITDNIDYFIPSQTIEETKRVVEENYKIVKDHFQSKRTDLITDEDLENFSLKIVVSYLQMYNHWRTMYHRHKNNDLKFISKDFENVKTSYEIINYFENKYPNAFDDKCSMLLDMTLNQFHEFHQRKKQFDNM
ncbi:MAG: hypothetical protein M3R17_15950 [Bacteroidota bacterium]|nr:hypothetical protein [Bacteroidota bacterium]